MIIREAEVVDNNDPDKKGKIKIRILPEMQDFQENMLPWSAVYSNQSGLSQDVGEHKIFEIGSLIRVIIEDEYYKKIRYISDDYIEGFYIYDSCDVSSISELDAQTYPQPYFKITKDGTIEFHNTISGEKGTLFKGGGYILHDKNGNIFVKPSSKIKIYNDSTSLKTILSDIQSIILDLVTPLNFVDGNGTPCTFSKAATDLPKIQQTLTNINALMED